MSFRHALCGWVPSDLSVYEAAWRRYGGSVNMHPDVVRFFMHEQKMKVDFWHREKEGDITGAYFETDKNQVGLNVWRDYPVSFDEVMLPVSPAQRFILPSGARRLSCAHRGSILNVLWPRQGRRGVCRIKATFSAKTTRKRNGELGRFLAAGGEILPLAGMPAGEIAGLYVSLFKARFGGTVRCYDPARIEALFGALPQLVAGNVLLFRGAPCAIDLVLWADSDRFMYVDVPNGGFDPALSAYSPGSLLMWVNIRDAREESARANKPLYFSIGLNEAGWGYKQRWAEVYPTGRALMI